MNDMCKVINHSKKALNDNVIVVFGICWVTVIRSLGEVGYDTCHVVGSDSVFCGGS